MDDPGEDFHVLILGSFARSLVDFRGPMISEMVERGWRVTAAAPDLDAATIDQLTRLGASSVEISLARTGMNPLADFRYYRQLLKVFETLKPSAVIAYTAKPVIWGAIASFGKPWRVVTMITGLGYAFTEDGRRSTKRFVARQAAQGLYRLALARADRVLFQNPDDRDLFQKLGLVRDARKTAVINGSGVDMEHYSLKPLPPAVSFLMVARLLGAKGVREYCQAAVELKRRYPTVAFRLAGWIDEGPDSIAASELSEWTDQGIEYLGRLGDVRPALGDAQVFVLPSYREGTPRSVLEAMAMGRPIITTTAPGCKETVVDGINGILVPPRTVDDLVRAMEEFVTKPHLASEMGRESYLMAKTKYDVRAVNDSILGFVRD